VCHRNAVTHFVCHRNVMTHFVCHRNAVTYFVCHRNAATHFVCHRNAVTHILFHDNAVKHFVYHRNSVICLLLFQNANYLRLINDFIYICYSLQKYFLTLFVVHSLRKVVWVLGMHTVDIHFQNFLVCIYIRER